MSSSTLLPFYWKSKITKGVGGGSGGGVREEVETTTAAVASDFQRSSSSVRRRAIRKRSTSTSSMASLLSLQNHYHQHNVGTLAVAMILLIPALLPSLFYPLGRASPSVFSEWNAPTPKHSALVKGALQRQISKEQKSDLWAPLAFQGWKPCTEPSIVPSLPESRGYIQVFLDGGLNQQRMGICDAVAVAKILNATLVIPHLELNPVWQDPSTFEEIFDVDRFIDVLKEDVVIVHELPPEFSWSTRHYYAVAVRDTRIKTAPAHAPANWYIEHVLPILQRHGIAAISPFAHCLAFDGLPEEVQKLRCKVNFEALEFVPHVKELGDTIITRLKHPAYSYLSHDYLHQTTEEAKRFVALHLRFDKDMAAHSGCDFGGGRAEKLALAKYRQNIWKGRVLNSQLTDEELRNLGRCPLTPEEVGLLLAALGFDNRTRLYLASYKVYGGEERISVLRELFPFMEDKTSLASEEELRIVEGKASLLAAVDYYVSMHSDISISASPGNMHNAMVGYRTYKNLKTILPNMALLGPLFLNKSKEWSEFQQAVQNGHRNRQGQIRIRKQDQSIYTYPAPNCMCQT